MALRSTAILSHCDLYSDNDRAISSFSSMQQMSDLNASYTLSPYELSRYYSLAISPTIKSWQTELRFLTPYNVLSRHNYFLTTSGLSNNNS